MGKETGFLEYNRTNNKDVPPEERIKNFEEFLYSKIGLVIFYVTILILLLIISDIFMNIVEIFCAMK